MSRRINRPLREVKWSEPLQIERVDTFFRVRSKWTELPLSPALPESFASWLALLTGPWLNALSPVKQNVIVLKGANDVNGETGAVFVTGEGVLFVPDVAKASWRARSSTSPSPCHRGTRWSKRFDTRATFAAVTVVLRFFMQYGTQELDRRAVLLAGEASRRTNDIVGLAMRFGGMLVGPLWFSLVTSSVASLFAIALMTALAVWTVALTASAAQPVMTNAAPSQLSADERVVLWAARVIYASYYLLASSIISVLTDLHHLPDAVKRGGLVVTVVYASAIVTTVIELARRRTTRRPVLDMLPAPVAMIFVGFALPSGATAMTGVELAGGVLLGVAFARYQLAFRDRATAEAMQQRPALLAAYNNLGTTSALLGYAVMSGLVAWSRHAGASYAAWAGSGVVLLGLAGAALVLMARARRQPATQAT